MTRPLLETIHGSHLYGLAHANSDRDTYVIIPQGRSRQNKSGQDDVNKVTLAQFLSGIERGTPQAVEALYSPYRTVIPEWAPYFNGLRPGTQLIATYRRTIKNFGLNYGSRHGIQLEKAKTTDLPKLRRHALRLCVNLSEFVTYGQINPVLSDQTARQITHLAGLPDEDYYAMLDHVLGTSLMGQIDL